MLGELARRYALLSVRDRLRWATLVPLGLAVAAVEALGGAVVASLVAMLSDPAAFLAHPRTQALVAWLPSARIRDVLVAVTMLTAAVHVVRTVLAVAVTWWQARLVATSLAALSTRVLRGYLSAPWAFHLRRNSAELLQNTVNGPEPFFGVFEAASVILTESLVVAALGVLLLALAPWQAWIGVVAIVLLLGGTLRLTRAAQRRGGEEEHLVRSALIRHLHEGLGGVKELKVLGRDGHVADRFAVEQASGVRLHTTKTTLDALPRVLTEAAFVLGLPVLILLTSWNDPSATGILPIVSLYAYAGFRTVPSAHRIALQVGMLRWNLAESAPLARDYDELVAARPARPDAPPIALRQSLALDRVSFSYERGVTPVLTDVSFEVRRGESVAIVGATGAGKTTLADLVMGLLEPSHGRVLVDGVPVDDRLTGWRGSVGYVPQALFLVDDTLRRNVALALPDEEVDDARVWRAVTAAQLGPLVRGLPDGLDTVVGERGIRLSGGERQRVAIARALYDDPPLLVLDEATSSLDPATERDLSAAIDALRGEKTLLVIAHRLSTVEHCDRIVVLEHGRVAAIGTYQDLVASSDAFRRLAALAPGATEPAPPRPGPR
ncbi:MAG: ABC transporter ATP-binding protein [Vicinamibacterales bacterium]